MPTLDAGDQFPALTVESVSATTLILPEHLEGHYGVVLFNRGAWCPFCTAQLTAFHRSRERLVQAGIEVVSLSTDSEAVAAALVAEHSLTFPVGFGAEISVLQEATGAFVHRDPDFVQATGFVLDPDGRVVVAVYSTGAIGRLVPADVIGVVSHHREAAGK